MSELIINATPSLLPSGTGNVNASNQGEASIRSVEGAGANTESPPESPFATALKSRMDKKASDTAAVESAASSAAATEVDAGNATSVDLSLLLPFLGANPTGTGGPASAPAAATEASPAEKLLPELQAATDPAAAQILAGLPATRAATLPAAQAAAGAEAPPATPAASLAVLSAAPAGTRPAAPGEGLPSGSAAVIETSPRRQNAEAMDHAFASAQQANSGGTGQAPGKMALDAAINADADSKGGRQNALEVPANDFHALMERATAMTPGVTSSSNGVPANPSLRIDTPLGQTGWQEEMGQKLSWMVGNGRQQADLVLTPPNLGRVEVSLTMNGDQASAIFTSSNPAVREALESSLHRLREVLADAGVSLGQAQVGSESPNPSPRREEAGGKPGFGDNDGLRYASNVAVPGATAVARTGAGRGMIDIFA